MNLLLSRHLICDGIPVDFHSLSLADQKRVVENNTKLSSLTANLQCRYHPEYATEVHTCFEHGLLHNTLFSCCRSFSYTLQWALKSTSYPCSIQTMETVQ